MCLQLGKYGVDPIRAYYELSRGALGEWSEAAQRLSAIEQLDLMQAVAYGGGNLTEEAAETVREKLQDLANGQFRQQMVILRAEDVIEVGKSPLL